MKKWILIYCIAVSVYIKIAEALNTTYPTCYNADDRYFYMRDDTGKVYSIDSHETVDYTKLEDTLPNFNVKYLLYTRRNPLIPQLLTLEDLERLKRSNFKMYAKTVFISHGWKGSALSLINIELTSAMLQNDDINVIVLDWSKLAMLCYPLSVAAIPIVGKEVGLFVKWLNREAVSYDFIHLIGFNLGGHVVGLAGRAADSNVRRITALDAAGPLFHWNPNAISKNDGRYVELIHTTCLEGIYLPLGHADYFPNGGKLQPGCVSSVCAHIRSWQLFKSAIMFKNKFIARRCNSLNEAHRNECNGDASPMGNMDLHKTESGIFGLTTTGSWPYYIE